MGASSLPNDNRKSLLLIIILQIPPIITNLKQNSHSLIAEIPLIQKFFSSPSKSTKQRVLRCFVPLFISFISFHLQPESVQIERAGWYSFHYRTDIRLFLTFSSDKGPDLLYRKGHRNSLHLEDTAPLRYSL